MDTNNSGTPTTKSSNSRLLPVLLVLLAALAGALYWFYFGGGAMKQPEITIVSKKKAESAQQAPAPPKPAPLPAVTAPEPSAAQKAELEKGRGIVPATLPALALAPDSAHVAVAIPPVANVLDQWIPVVQRIFKNDVDVRAEIDKQVRSACGFLGAAPDGDAVASLRSIGLDTARPAGLFLEPQEALRDFLKTAAATRPDNPVELQAPPLNDLFAFSVALPVSDKARVEQLLQMAQAFLGGGAAPAQETVDEFSITILPGIGAYCLTDQWAVVGNSDKLVKETVARFKAPRQTRYGSEACPAFDANEVTLQFFMGRAFSFFRDLAEVAVANQPSLKPLIEAQLKDAEAMFPAGDADDPALYTFSLTGERLELRGRVDTAAHKGLLEQMGVPQAMDLARKLPENTGMLFALSVTQNFKQQLSNSVKQAASNLPPDARDRDKKVAQQASTYVDQAMGALGSQFAGGIAGVTANGLPAIYILLESNNPILPQLLMGLAGVTMVEDLGEGVQIQKVNRPLPLGLEVYGTMVNKAFLVSTDLDGLKALVDRVKNNATTQVFEKFEPPVDPDTPRFLLIAIKPQLYLDTVMPMLKQLLPPSTTLDIANDVMIEVARLVRDLRFLAEMNGTWFENRVVLNLNPNVQ
ncbi:MAG: hypothetical protein KBH78_06520 [Candidatus Hydrogenedentes bacterium]|nr:hypothetical protein [Candidatus Hydrogenedentota bacterium]